jgi:hypothetical protein
MSDIERGRGGIFMAEQEIPETPYTELLRAKRKRNCGSFGMG